MLGRSLALATVILASPGARAAPDGRLQPEAAAVLEQMGKTDTVAAMNESRVNAEVVLSVRAFRAIEAVERYRRSVQWKELTPAERKFDNFDFFIPARGKALSLKGEERETCYEVTLFARRQPGEGFFLDVPAKIGRNATYVVRKSDFSVLRADLAQRAPN